MNRPVCGVIAKISSTAVPLELPDWGTDNESASHFLRVGICLDRRRYRYLHHYWRGKFSGGHWL